MLQALNIPLNEFLRPFFDSDDTVHFRIFDDRKTDANDHPSAFTAAKPQCKAGKIDDLIGTLHKHNARNRGVFFVVNSGGDSDEEITRINAQFVEMDDASFDEQEARIEAFALPPSLIVRTRKSYHCYWLTKNADVSKFRRIQKQLVAQFDGDPACVNESRVLRLPGFKHCKQEPVEVVCVKFAPELRYTQDELAAVLPDIPNDDADKTTSRAAGATPKGTRKGLTLVGKRCDFIRHCKTNAATLSEFLWYGMITNLEVFEDGERAIHALSKPYPKYSYAETQGKIAHFLASNTKPMTCAKIAELGWKCPKLETGECGCKSPAALCYKAMTTAELLENLNVLEKRPTQLENIQLIREFILDYLYNVEPVIAETLINHNIKSSFGLTATDLRPLLQLHRETYKKYADSKETRRERDGAELPEWYEITERGGLRFLPGVLAGYMAKNLAAFYGAGSYYFYTHGVYEAREDLAAFAAVREQMIERSAKSAEISDAEKQWKSAIRKMVKEINANPFIVNVRNGLYNVLDGSFKPHTTEYFSTVQINANYDPGCMGEQDAERPTSPTAKCPMFLKFLEGMLPETEIPLIQEIFGYLLIPVNKAQKSFVFVGAPNAGKSTLLSIAQEVLLGSENVSNIPWQGLGDRFNKAELFGKLANIFADLPSKAIDDGGMFKSLTGEDYVNAERKGKDPFNFRPYARLLFSCNEIPKNYSDRSDGFYRRLIIIRFDKSVPPGRRDPNLRERVASERDGILTWALDGLRRLIANNYIFSETERTIGEVTRYKVECNSALTFVTEYCDTGEGWTAREELYSRYKDFCFANGYKAMSQMNFNKEIETNYAEVKRGQDKVSGRKVWRGIKFIDGGKEQP